VIFTLSARLYFNLFVALKSQLKLQFEVFFKTVILQILENKTRKPEIQEVALDMLVEFCSEPHFITDLYVNYDCDLYCSNIWEMLCKYLYKVRFVKYLFLRKFSECLSSEWIIG
jgi:brefeldin A-resistance guanine nucleotide exchange factor 1